MKIIITKNPHGGINCVENSNRNAGEMAYRLTGYYRGVEYRVSRKNPHWSHGSMESQERLWAESTPIPVVVLADRVVAESWAMQNFADSRNSADRI